MGQNLREDLMVSRELWELEIASSTLATETNEHTRVECRKLVKNRVTTQIAVVAIPYQRSLSVAQREQNLRTYSVNRIWLRVRDAPNPWHRRKKVKVDTLVPKTKSPKGLWMLDFHRI